MSAPVPPYAALAAGYDAVMAHVDYGAWAVYLDDLLHRHHPEAADLVELGCGTAALAVALQPLGPPPTGWRYRAFDGSEAMVAAAREAVRRAGVPVSVGVLDFRQPVPPPAADAVVLVYDGLNYLLDPDDVRTLFKHVGEALRPGGVFLVDQSTPANSLHHADGFDDAGRTAAFEYVRSSAYDAEARLHTTTFRLRFPDGSEQTETHVQRAYTPAEVRALAEAAGFTVDAAYDGFSDDPAHAESDRVHWVLRKEGGVKREA